MNIFHLKVSCLGIGLVFEAIIFDRHLCLISSGARGGSTAAAGKRGGDGWGGGHSIPFTFPRK